MQLRPEMIDTRVERRLRELERWIYEQCIPITDWRPSNKWPAHIPQPAAIAPLVTDVPEVDESPTHFAQFPHVHAKAFWASTTVTIPERWAGKRVFAHMNTGSDGFLSESTVYLNGCISGGLDINRKDILLAPHAEAGQTFRLDVMVHSGRMRTPQSISGDLVVINEAIYQFRYDLRATLGAVRSLDKEHPTAIRLWYILEQTLNAIDFHSDYNRVNVEAAAQLLKEKTQALLPTHQPPDFNLYLCANSHIDVVWLWTLAETRQKMARTSSTAVRYMDELPEYHFSQSQAQLYDFLLNDHPDLFAAVQEKVSGGQWEFVGAAWVEPDCNITGGESLIRQLLYGQKFWKQHFGTTSRTMWLVDTFGYASAMPQILRKSGLDTFVTQKLTWSETNPFPYGHFDWEGIDGSRIRCVFPQSYVTRTYPDEMMQWYKRYPSKDIAPDLLYLYGYGDGGGGPVREDVELGKRMQEFPAYPRVKFSRVEDALDAIKSRADALANEYGYQIPVWKGELYLEFHRGTLTTHALVKRRNRKNELLLREAEIWAALAEINNGAPYPDEALENNWKKLMLLQFHDILPGTSIAQAYPDVHRIYGEIETEVKALLDKAIAQLETPNIQPPYRFSVLNSLSFTVTDWAEADIPLKMPFTLQDTQGKWIAFQVLHESEESTKIGLEATVTPFAATQYVAVPEAPKALPENNLPQLIEQALADIALSDADLFRMWLGLTGEGALSTEEIGQKLDLSKEEVKEIRDHVMSHVAKSNKNLKEKALEKFRKTQKAVLKPMVETGRPQANETGMENAFFRVTFNPDGSIDSLFDKRLQREWLTGKGNDLQTFEDRPNSWDAWDINDWFEQKPLGLLNLEQVTVVENGPIRATVRFDYKTHNGSVVSQCVVMYQSIPRIDFRTVMDWHEQHVLLKVAFPVAVHSASASYEIQYGTIERPTSRNTTWEQSKFEVSGHRWTDLSDASGGVSILNDGKYGHDIHHNVMRMSLIRTPVHPDPQAPHPPFHFLDDPNVFTDQGEHEVNYAFYPHAGDWRNGTVQAGYVFNQPLRSITNGPILENGLSVSDDACLVETLKKAEDGEGYILRVYEAHGGTRTVTISLPFSITKISCTNLMEVPEPIEHVEKTSENSLTFSLKPYEIRTFKIK